MNWVKASIDSDPFGSALLDAGISEATIKAWTVDPQVTLLAEDAAEKKSEKGSLFDTLECLDVVACTEKAAKLAKL